MNKIILLGRLTRDPEIRTTSSGTTTANFTVAVNRNFKNKDGNYDADFLSCVAFRNTADFISKYFKKGRMISLEGRVQTRNYETEDGTKRYVTEIVVEGVEFAGDSKKEESEIAGDEDNKPELEDIDLPSSYRTDYEENPEISLSDNDLPF